MIRLNTILVSLLLALLTQSAFASSKFNEEEIAACIPVGQMAIKISGLQDQGIKKELIEVVLSKNLDSSLSLWVKPITRLVFSEHKPSSEKVVKQAIGYCLNIKKMHNKMSDMANYDA